MVNMPFAGALAPAAYHRTDRRVQAVMIEVNREHYRQDASDLPGPYFDTCRATLARVVRSLIARATSDP